MKWVSLDFASSAFFRFVYNKEVLEKMVKSSTKLLSVDEKNARLFLASIYLSSKKAYNAKLAKSLHDTFEDRLTTLSTHLTTTQIINNPKLVVDFTPEKLRQTVDDLHSMGVTKVKPSHLIKTKLIWQLNEREWKDYKLIDNDVDCAVSYIASNGYASDSTKQSIYDRLCQECPDYKLMPIGQLKEKIDSLY